MIKLCITDDHPLILEGLRMVLHHQQEIHVVRTCMSGEELIGYLGSGEHPDIILLDINMPGINGIEACGQIKKSYPAIKIIGLSMNAENHLVKLMMKNGADGYLHKNSGADEIIQAIHDVMAGRIYVSDEISSNLLQAKAHATVVSNSPFPRLSAREKEILRLIIDEKTTQEIAQQLFISFGTVETHRRNIIIKLGVKNTAGLVRTALEYNLTREE
jgi:DNA-binding NarL/FixJ family response regulator